MTEPAPSALPRPDGRAADQLRPVSLSTDFISNPAGSALIRAGDTIVLCTASVEERLPRWRRDSGLGWVTGEYAMLPASTNTRSVRESARGKRGGRTLEIQRLIGRSLRAVCDFEALGERSVTIDCDVLQADGGTRTASITGGFVALARAVDGLLAQGLIDSVPFTGMVAAISVGIIDGVALLDLPYVEDSAADVDMNVVMNSAGRLIEVQGTAEGVTFSIEELNTLVQLASVGINELFAAQAAALADCPHLSDWLKEHAP
ncbi:MAG: ribonuclease PH [Myxococcales bacterium]|nr:ribonuclease PH [Myxococcales bacterium]